MAGVQRTLILPSEGYGDEPKSEADVLLTAAARVQAALPSGWTLKTRTEVGGLDDSTNTYRRADSRLALVREGKIVVTYVVEVKRVLTSNSLLPAINQLLALRSDKSARMRPMLIARYLSSQQQRVLQERGIAYADATGNLRLTSDDPLILLSDRGASADPWRGPGRPTTSLKGLPAAKLVRALADFVPPYSVADLADLAGASLGAAYRLCDYLAGERLLTRVERGPITDVDWPELLRRWSQEARYLDTSTTRGFLEPRGLDNLVEKLGNQTPSQRYAVSGSLATQPYAPYAEARMGLIYAQDPVKIASDLGLRPVETGANVILAAPRSPAVFERTSTWRDVTIVAPSQAVADLLGGPGRNPAEGDYLLGWMKENEDAWRQQLDR
ncbi:hypothetical protein [Jiangella mangrovi]|uniref:HTH iclR-type domain-containing protein n=1 Tax=Jiangella mangrovi TaxID=1524084 RepID=A0A7W9LJI0_9ACTN|nr:hypothetical protein [Jiangella mangrovi]MBB5786044.1 hypothetical protein [Jiangella mangrovi]